VVEAPPTRATVLILDFGSQYSQLIARRVREASVYCELVPGTTPWSELAKKSPSALILSGGPASVYEPGAPQVDPAALKAGIPVLGICYGMQLIAHHLGGEVEPGPLREFGPAMLEVEDAEGLFAGLPAEMPVWMSHGDHIPKIPPGFRGLARSANSRYAAFSNDAGIMGIQFHPEVVHTPHGRDILRNFLYRVSGLTPTWTAGSYIAEAVETIRSMVGGGRVLCALSGGVDSAVAAALVHRAVGDRLTCIYVDHGLTGTNRERPGLREALAACRAGDTLVVTKLDRLARSLPDARAIAEDLTKRKVRLNLGASVYDPTDPVGRLLFNVLAMVAEFEADLIRSRTREGMRVAKAKGHLRGKQPKLNPRQEAHLVELLRSGEYSTAELGDLFGVARSTV